MAVSYTHLSLYAEEVKKELEKAAEEVCIFTFQAGEEQKNLHTVSKPVSYTHLDVYKRQQES